MHTINKNKMFVYCESGDDLNSYLEILIFNFHVLKL
jgi:hypothetical protein